MEIYVAYCRYHSDTTIVYVGIDLDRAKKEAMKNGIFAYEHGVEVWKDGEYDRDIEMGREPSDDAKHSDT